MNALWSRASQAHRCGCRACKTVANGAGRRVTTSAPGRRKITFAEAFTACYSSVFASATVIDAIRKEDRRSELDRQLDEVRRELADLREQAAGSRHAEAVATDADAAGADDMSAESSIAYLTDGQMAEIWASLAAIYHGRPHFKEIHKPALLRESQLRQTLQEELYRCSPDGLPSTETALERLERAVQLEEDGGIAIARRDPKERVHLRRCGDGISRLVEALMTKADSNTTATSTDSSSSKPCPSFDEAARLLDDGYPRYTFRGINPQAAQSNTQQLNRANRSAIYDGTLGLKERIGRVCYNLLVSAYPPDMQVLNSLVVAFDRQPRDYALYSDAVVSSFFWRSRLMPTPATYPAILHHHRVTNNHGMFLRTLACIAGQDRKTGAKVGRRVVGDEGRWGGNYHKAPRDRTQGGDYVWQHAPVNSLMVNELLRGLLQFHMVDHAMALFASCLRTGVHMASGLVRHVLDECLATLDWKGAVALVRHLSRESSLWPALVGSSARDDATAAYIVDRVSCLLDMAGLSSTSSDHRLASLGMSQAQLASFISRVRDTGDALGVPVYDSSNSSELRASKSRLLQIESIDKELIRVRKTTKSIESRMIKPDLPLDFRVSVATYTSAAAVEASERLRGEVQDVLDTVAQQQRQHRKQERPQAQPKQKPRREAVAAAAEQGSAPRPSAGTLLRKQQQQQGLGMPERYGGLIRAAFETKRSGLGAQEHHGTW